MSEKILNPNHVKAPYDCPYYYNNWNCDDMCKDIDDYCQYDEFTGCPEYNDISGKRYIKIRSDEIE